MLRLIGPLTKSTRWLYIFGVKTETDPKIEKQKVLPIIGINLGF